MDLTPSVPEERQLIQAYRPGGFRVGDRDHEGSVLVFPDRTLPWAVAGLDELTLDALRPVLEAAPRVELLLLGCGDRFAPVPVALRRELRERGVVAEAMGTAAACRTYNVLVAEERRVAAALIAVT